MLRKAIRLFLYDRATFYQNVRIRRLGWWCGLFEKSGFHCQGRMDIDPRSMWHNKDFVTATGGYFIPGDKVQRKVLQLEPWDLVRRDMIILLLKSLLERSIEGEMAELGVYKGSSARLIHYYVPERRLYLFDTFSGFDHRDVEKEKAKTGLHTPPTSFSDTTVEIVLKNINQRNDNVQVFPGYFPQSAPEFLEGRKFAFVHLDADLYDPIHAGLDYFYDKVSPGGFILVHDFHSWPGARQAVLEFLRNKPEVPIPMPDKSGSALIVKSAVPLA